MRVLFVASGNQKIEAIAPFVKTQMESLSKIGIEVSLYIVLGRGVRNYLHNAKLLRKQIKRFKPDIVHAHYSLCGYVSYLAAVGCQTKVVCSLMGSDMTINLPLVRTFASLFWDKTIVKSDGMKQALGLNNIEIVPNGVDLNMMSLRSKDDCRQKVEFEKDKKYIIWCSQTYREEKNFALAKSAVEYLNDSSVVLLPLEDVKYDEINTYMRAADVLLLSSSREGSPNVIKEAMACNLPIATTDVGDVRWLLDGVSGCYIAEKQETESLARCIQKALEFNDSTNGREKILSLKLSTEGIAYRLKDIYQSIL